MEIQGGPEDGGQFGTAEQCQRDGQVVAGRCAAESEATVRRTRTLRSDQWISYA